ncbi:Contactin-associated protein-like 2 [Mactra antiquata]
MAALVKWSLILISMIIAANGASYDPLKIQQPSISVVTELNGYIGLSSGDNGDVRVDPGVNGSVFLDGEDLLYIIEMIESQPPVWQTDGPVSGQTPYGYLGEFHAGQKLNIGVSAVDPEGTSISYTLVAGDFPPGVKINQATGSVTGIIPDADATYSFTIRATDTHGKFADNVFKMVVRGYDRCSTSNPCQHEGICTDTMESFKCDCIRPYGGTTCNLACGSNPLGIQASLRYVTDAQITGYNTYSSYYATNARLGGSGWRGEDSTSYVQIDFGNLTDIYRVDMSYSASNYYTSYYFMEYSLDGNYFYNYTDFTGNTIRLRGMTSSGVRSHTLPSVLSTRYVRVYPTDWNKSYRPGFALEMYGCYNY